MGWIDCSVRGASVCAESDGCRDNPCFRTEDGLVEVACNDIPAPGAGFVCDPCPSGYAGDGFECFDIDDCIVYNENTVSLLRNPFSRLETFLLLRGIVCAATGSCCNSTHLNLLVCVTFIGH